MAEELKLGTGTTLRVVAHTDELLQLQATYAGGGAAPPAHLHPAQDERFEVLEGAMSTRVNQRDGQLGGGDVLEIPRGTAHQMWNAGNEPAVVDWRTMPAGRTLEWFRALAALLGGQSPSGAPALLAEYDDVFRLVED
jgi:mannose-6-phosphate isomerase-like protein (cupin superfamily)